MTFSKAHSLACAKNFSDQSFHDEKPAHLRVIALVPVHAGAELSAEKKMSGLADDFVGFDEDHALFRAAIEFIGEAPHLNDLNRDGSGKGKRE